MDVLSSESLERLRRETLSKPELINAEFKDIQVDLNLDLVPFNADVDVGSLPTLELPTGGTQETLMDLENCKLLSASLSDLSAANATDERFWATLCFGMYADYAQKRWPLKKGMNPANHVANHWFAKNSRDRMRDNAVSRLWWMAHIAKRVPNTSLEDVLRTLFFNSDYRSSLLERNTSANAINVVVSILSISQKAFADGIGFHRPKFRDFMKKVDFIGKRTSLPSLGLEELEALLSPAYAEAYGTSKKKEGLLARFKNKAHGDLV